jgi:hypothetical protein
MPGLGPLPARASWGEGVANPVSWRRYQDAPVDAPVDAHGAEMSRGLPLKYRYALIKAWANSE